MALDHLTAADVAAQLAGLGVELGRPSLAVTADGVPVYGFAIDPDAAVATHARLAAVHDHTGLWPFVSHDSPEEWCAEARAGGPDRLATALARNPGRAVAELTGSMVDIVNGSMVGIVSGSCRDDPTSGDFPDRHLPDRPALRLGALPDPPR
ncbi:hypothetical protein [Streptomyces sp. NPDC001530]|uniref:hypothetical protein n=1 Tax=Streptomyces sp. NPDC001530 TaxID=3364582 RepID=UPI0036A61A36